MQDLCRNRLGGGSTSKSVIFLEVLNYQIDYENINIVICI